MATVYKSLTQSTSRPSEEQSGRRNRQRVLILSSRGVTYRFVMITRNLLMNRHRHLLNDLSSLLPHGRKESKLDTKTKLFQLNELAELYNCNNVLFFEARKAKDLYM